MNKKLFLILLLLLCAVVVGTASAQNMSITDMGIMSRQTVQIYWGTNGTLFGTWNTTSNGIQLPPGDFLMVVKPTSSDVLGDPAAFMETVFTFVETNAVSLVVLLFLIGLTLRKW